jgi:pimeloyl-ACP methyl ester carboxylesterase
VRRGPDSPEAPEELEVVTASRLGTIRRVTGDAGYPLAVREWTPSLDPPTAVLVLLHGVVSHSEWLSPIAHRLSEAGCLVVCPDRRGSGLNEQEPGDAASAQQLCADAAAVVEAFRVPDRPLHLGGFCWGATWAIHVLQRTGLPVDSLIMIAPSIFPHADVGGAALEVHDSSEPTEEPNVPIDRFTSGPSYAGYIVGDPLRTRRVSPRFNGVLVDMNRFLAPRWAKLTVPTLMIQARDDRLADVEKHSRAFRNVQAHPRHEVCLPGGHGVQFDAPGDTAREILAWVEGQR